MNFVRLLPALGLCMTLPAQTMDVQATGGGGLLLDGARYRFELSALFTAPPKGGLPGAFRLRGRLIPETGGASIGFDLTVLKTGALYMLRMDRKGPGGYPDSWAATTHTRLRPVSLQDGPGGRVELDCLGSLAAVIAQKPRTIPWQGRIWAAFPGKAARP